METIFFSCKEKKIFDDSIMASIPIQQNPMMIDKVLFEKSNKIEYTPIMKRDKKMSDLETLLTQKVYLKGILKSINLICI